MKICSVCGQSKALDEFHVRKKSKDGRQGRCKLCANSMYSSYYAENAGRHREVVTARFHAQRETLREQVLSYLGSHYCVDCGNDDLRVLQFDHVRGTKKYDISSIIGRGLSVKTLSDEIKKCEVRCANCHQIKTFERAGNWRIEKVSQL